jgi:4'-phosphopantetheinyl transferase
MRALGDALDVHGQERAGRCRVPELARAYIVARGLLRAALGAYLRQSAASIRLTRGRHGQPFIEGAALRFNASDSGDVVLMGFALGAELGVDIEHIRPMPDALSIAQRFFLPRMGARG